MTVSKTIHDEVALNLALAVVVSSQAPLLLLDGDLSVVAASSSFCRAFQIDPTRVAGSDVFALGKGEWNVPQFRSLLNVTLSGGLPINTYEMDLKRHQRNTRRLALRAEKLVYGDIQHPRILLSVSDITDARVAERVKDDLIQEKDDLLSDKEILLRELQHRVANSLQIVASVLMLSAHKVQSEETRVHLHDAHNRVMSIAALQDQLSVSRIGDIKLRSYFTRLCESLGASMIRDHKQIQLEVVVDDSAVSADVSVSLGLIVTELVINALKHAFPEDRVGKILVDYASRGRDWTLSVSDDGVGISHTSKNRKVGLGTSLIEALAKQLKASVHIANAKPGTVVSVANKKGRGADEGTAPIVEQPKD